jgi:hypothetical protein
MRFECSDGDLHPFTQREKAQQTVKFGLALSPIEPENSGLTGSSGSVPDAEDVPVFRESGCGNCLGTLAIGHLGGWGSFGNFDLELD